MAYKQLRAVHLSQTGPKRLCLQFTRKAFGIAAKYPDAWTAWQHSKRHQEALPNAYVPVFFTWTGKIGGVTKNWGDVAIWVPGHGVFGSPLEGIGNRWDPSVEARAAAIGGGAKYVGWSEDLNGADIVQKVADPAPVPPQTKMPAIGSTIRITIKRTTYYPGTVKVAGTLNPGAGYSYIVRGYDAKFPGRILLYTASGGGNVALALYYVNGQKIEGWS